MVEVPDIALTWLVGGRDCGSSSEAIWRHMVLSHQVGNCADYPRDPSDLGRCLRLLHLIPEWAGRMDEMAAYGPSWKVLAENWGDLRAVMEGEVGIDWSKGRTAPITYKRMHELLDDEWRALHPTPGHGSGDD